MLRFSLATSEVKRGVSGKAFFNVEGSVLSANPSLLLTIKTIVYHLGFDGGVGDCPSLDNPQAFLTHPKVAPVWEPFAPTQGDKKAIGEALFSFCTTLRISLRQVFLHLATNSKYEGIEESSERMNPLFLPKIASNGDTFSVDLYHSIVPPDLIQHSPQDLLYYGISKETQCLLERSNFQAIDAIQFNDIDSGHESLLTVAMYSSPIQLPLTARGRRTPINYNDREYKNLDGEPDACVCDGYASTLATEVNQKELSVRVVYTVYDLRTKETLRTALSWHVALLKSRVYEKIVDAHREVSLVGDKKGDRTIVN